VRVRGSDHVRVGMMAVLRSLSAGRCECECAVAAGLRLWAGRHAEQRRVGVRARVGEMIMLR
jgi:hypothetical protein